MMAWLEPPIARVRAWLRREAIIDEIEQEMRSHIELATEANIARGMDADAARADALRGFGNLTRMSELAYDVRAGGRLETMWQDLRFGVRTLVRNPGFAAVAILTLALGTGATAAIFSFVQLPLYNLRSMEQLRNESTGDERAGLALVGTFAAFALALASVGVYGVMAVMVAGRSREIGIRLALGARPHDVRWMIVRDGAALTGVGIVIGLIAAFALTRLMQALLFETPSTDPATFSTVGAVVAVAAMLACWVPARRSARVDPAIALRAE